MIVQTLLFTGFDTTPAGPTVALGPAFTLPSSGVAYVGIRNASGPVGVDTVVSVAQGGLVWVPLSPTSTVSVGAPGDFQRLTWYKAVLGNTAPTNTTLDITFTTTFSLLGVAAGVVQVTGSSGEGDVATIDAVGDPVTIPITYAGPTSGALALGLAKIGTPAIVWNAALNVLFDLSVLNPATRFSMAGALTNATLDLASSSRKGGIAFELLLELPTIIAKEGRVGGFEDPITVLDHFHVGNDYIIRYTLFEADGTTPKLVDGQAFSWTMRPRANSSEIQIEKTSAVGGGISISGNVVDVTIEDTDTIPDGPGRFQKMLRRTDPGLETPYSHGYSQVLPSAGR